MSKAINIPLHVTEVTIQFHETGAVTTSLDAQETKQAPMSRRERHAAWARRVDAISAITVPAEREAAMRLLRRDQDEGFREAKRHRNLVENGRQRPVLLNIIMPS